MNERETREVRERDILVAPNEYAYVQDLTKGDIVLYVGPTKISLSNTERLVIFEKGRFAPIRGEEASLGVHPFVEASCAQYIILENPPKDIAAKPVKGANSASELQIGRKIVVPGPALFPLWPGQRAQVVNGHSLRQDEYLVVRVYDAIAGDDTPIGTERIVRGTEVSFYIPRTGLEVVPERGSYVRKAWRMEKNAGLHVRIRKPFLAKEGDLLPAGSYQPGQDVFLSDQEGFFFPNESVEVVSAVTPMLLAEKQGIYVRNLDTGAIATVAGTRNYLPDPTQEEVVERNLDPERLALYGLTGHDPKRAISVYIPPNFAVLVTAKNKREVVGGPQTRLLNYDEELEVLTLSTGRPKSDDQLLPTCFLQMEGNKVSDLVQVKTADHVELEVTLSYRVSFVGEAEKWFKVKNYVGLLCDHLGSIIRAAVRGSPIDAFHANSTELLRTAVLGPHQDNKRSGRHFEENGMWVYDLEVLEVRILDGEVQRLLAEAQRKAIVSEINRKEEQLRLGDQRMRETVNQEICGAQITTIAKVVELESAKRQMALRNAGLDMELDQLRTVGKAKSEAQASAIATNTRLDAEARQAEIETGRLAARATAFKEQMQAMQPELITTLKMVANQQMASELSRHLSPLAILGGESVADVATRLLAALPLGASGDRDTIRKLLKETLPVEAKTDKNDRGK